MRSFAVPALLLGFLLATILPPDPVGAETSAAPAAPAVIAIIGDSLADGMWGGLYKLVQKDKQFKLYRGAKNSVGFTGAGLTDMIDRAFAAGETHALVMMIGANDRRSFFADGKSKALLGTPAWIELYRERVGKFMDHAGKKNVPLVWILLPVMRETDATRDAALVNGLVVEAAKSRSHVALIETAKLTTDEKGAYVAHFNDLGGQKRQMRAGDGVHFEQPAYEVIGDLVLKRLRELSPRFKITTSE